MLKDINFVRENVKKALELYLNDSPKDISFKSSFDLVTEIDKNIEGFLNSKIKEAYPNDNIVSEETRPDEMMKGRCWTVDPIDGTLNMVHNIKLFGVQVSLFENEEPLLSYVYFPVLKEEYYAYRGGGCFHNGEKVGVKVEAFENAILSIGDFSHTNKSNSERQYRGLEQLYKSFSRVRMFGSAALDYACVACGKTQACMVITKNLWDVLPGYILCKEAGAFLCNLKGGPYKIGDDGLIAAANKELADRIVTSLKE